VRASPRFSQKTGILDEVTMNALTKGRRLLAGAWAIALALGSCGSAMAERKPTTPEEMKHYEEVFMEQVRKGDLLFHGSPEMSKKMSVTLSTQGMACAMCHPMASDTHPGSFPKFQPSMGRFVALRDMVNWCIGNVNKGVPLDADSDAMKALEAYIYWSNSGSVLSTGKY
jgi:thiosulfate dehydrogenase